MKKFAWFGLGVFVLILSISFTSCKNVNNPKSYDEMLQVYNSKYFSLTPTDPIEKNINDSDFNQSSMLDLRYTFIEGYESTLAAPVGGAKYLWQKQNHDGTFAETPLCEKRIYNFAPEEDFEINAETKLVLTVTNNSGTEYIDTTIIVVLNRE